MRGFILAYRCGKTRLLSETVPVPGTLGIAIACAPQRTCGTIVEGRAAILAISPE